MISLELVGSVKIQVGHQVRNDGIAVVRVAGRVMLGLERGKIGKALDELLAQGQRRFVIDLSGVEYMDSTGIGCFVAALNKVKEAGGELRMSGAARRFS